MNNVQSGRAFEYGLAYRMSRMIESELIEDSPMRVAQDCYEACEKQEQEKIMAAGKETALFLSGHEERLKQGKCRILIQSDMRGKSGDVRDIVIQTPDGEVGISAKNRHFAVKHSRLSENIDFGKLWARHPCSQKYYNEILPIFKELRSRQTSGQLWKEIPDKADRFYVPILNAFSVELKRICQTEQATRNILRYLLGKSDYYKIIKHNGTVSVQSFNIDGTLHWGSRVSLPRKVFHSERKSTTTLVVIFSEGWQLSFRIHNASSKIEPSLKFDVQIIGLPQKITQHEFRYM